MAAMGHHRCVLYCLFSMQGYIQSAVPKRPLISYFVKNFNGKSSSNLILLNLIKEGFAHFLFAFALFAYARNIFFFSIAL